jgi:hypothetical protein
VGGGGGYRSRLQNSVCCLITTGVLAILADDQRELGRGAPVLDNESQRPVHSNACTSEKARVSASAGWREGGRTTSQSVGDRGRVGVQARVRICLFVCLRARKGACGQAATLTLQCEDGCVHTHDHMQSSARGLGTLSQDPQSPPMSSHQGLQLSATHAVEEPWAVPRPRQRCLVDVRWLRRAVCL